MVIGDYYVNPEIFAVLHLVYSRNTAVAGQYEIGAELLYDLFYRGDVEPVAFTDAAGNMHYDVGAVRGKIKREDGRGADAVCVVIPVYHYPFPRVHRLFYAADRLAHTKHEKRIVQVGYVRMQITGYFRTIRDSARKQQLHEPRMKTIFVGYAPHCLHIDVGALFFQYRIH